MLIKAYNRGLIKDKEKTFLTAAANASATSLTVVSTDLAPAGTSSNTWSDNNYMIVGEIGSENAEVMQMAAAVTSATSLTVDREGQAGGLRYNHSIGEPVYKIDFNQVIFYHNTTNSTTSLTTLTTVNLQPDDEFTRYDDNAYSTGYGFIRFYNATTAAYSSYSDGVNYESSGEGSSRDPRTLWMLRKKVRLLVDEPTSTKLTDERIDDALNDKQRDIAHTRLWSFFETVRSDSRVEDQFAYDIPSSVQLIHNLTIDTQPIVFLSRKQWDNIHWDTDNEGADPSHACIWNNQLLIYPRVSASADSTALDGDITASATTITVDDTSDFNRGDYYRFIIDSEVIYATGSTSTTFTGCLRGQEGTTAATHSDDATVTERDIVYSAHVEPTDLLDTQDRTAIPEPEVLSYGAAMDIALFLGKETLHDRLKIKYEQGFKNLESKYAMKQTSQFGRVKAASEFLSDGIGPLSNPNLYPRDIG